MEEFTKQIKIIFYKMSVLYVLQTVNYTFIGRDNRVQEKLSDSMKYKLKEHILWLP